MDIFYDYTLTAGTSEGSAALNDGTKIWYTLQCGLKSPTYWGLGIATAPDIDILGEMQGVHQSIFFEEGFFPSPMDEVGLMEFIETRLIAFERARDEARRNPKPG